MLKVTYTVLFWSVFFVYTHGQQNAFQWRVGAHGGLINYYGDLSYKFWDPNPRLNNLTDNTNYLSYGVSLEKSLSQAWSLRFLWSNGEFIANDRTIDGNGDLRTGNPDFQRSLNARAEINDVALTFNYHFDNDIFFGRNAAVAPFLMAGIGRSDFDVFGDLLTADGQRYHYWSDNTVRDVAENSGMTGKIIEQDGQFETKLSSLNTEGVGYSTNLLHFSAGLGLKIRLSDRLNLNLETVFRFTDTDYLDDVAGKYPPSYDNEFQAYASNPANLQAEFRGDPDENNDIYSFSSISLHYNFGRKKQAFRAPVVRTGFLSQEEQLVMPRDTMPSDSPEEVSATGAMTALPFADSLFNLLNTISRQIATLTEGISNAQASSESSYTERIDSLGTAILSLKEGQGELADSLRQEFNVKMLALEKQLLDLRQTMNPSEDEISRDSVDVENDPVLPAELPPVQDTVAQEKIEDVTRQDTIASQSTDDRPQAAPATKDTIVQLIQPVLDSLQKDTVVQVIEREAPLPEERASSAGEVSRLKEQLDVLKEAIRDLETQPEIVTIPEEQKTEIRSIREELRQQEVLIEEGRADEQSVEELRRSLTTLQLQLAAQPTAPSRRDTTIVMLNRDTIQNAETKRLQTTLSALSSKVDRLEQALVNDTMQALMTNPEIKALREKSEELQTQLNTLKRERATERQTQQKEMEQLQRQVASMEVQLDYFRGKFEEAQKPAVDTPSDYSLLEKKIEGQALKIAFFTTGSTKLNLAARNTLEEVLALMRTHDRLRVRLTGFTDTSGNPAYNRTLAEKRAQAVAAYLRQQGIAQDRITVDAAGEDPDAEAEYGRRVEMRLVIGE